MGINNTLTEAEADEVCWMVLRLCRAVRDEVKRDDIAPVDYRPYPCSDATLRAENLSGRSAALTASGRDRHLTGGTDDGAA